MSTMQLRNAHAAGRDLPSSLARQARSLARGVWRAVDLLLIWQQRARDRRELEALNDHMLRDLGLTRADIYAEASKPFWRP